MADHHDRQQILDEAYQRLHATGPEFDDWLTNHGPMAVEALAHHDRAEVVHRWIDMYQERLEEFPRASDRITADNWPDALGDPKRLGDWPQWFNELLAERRWEDVLAEWWPRLLPGLAASATHGVIRVGHAVRTLREQGANPLRLEELSQAFGYWAARWQPVPGISPQVGTLDAASALAAVPRIGDQSGGIGHRLEQLATMPDWATVQASVQPLRTTDDAPAFVRSVVTASVGRYLDYGHGNGVMMVHASTAPNAVLRVLPSLPREQWSASAAFAWTVSAAVQAAYAPAAPADADALRQVSQQLPASEEVFDLAVSHGDEHVIKFADTAIDVNEWTDDPTPLRAAARSAHLIGRQ